MAINDLPVLVIAFNRPNHVIGLIDILREIKPKKLYFAVDGPRAGYEKDQVKVDQVRMLKNNIDWECQVFTKFSNENLGCKLGPVSAIDWIFEHEERAIILEDDVRPNFNFFEFCSDLLDFYENEHQVFLISGSNSLAHFEGESSYRFSALPYIWGWATWRRAWHEYSVDMRDWRSELGQKGVAEFFGCSRLEAFILSKFLFDRVAKNKLDAWDYQWVYFAMKTNKLAAISNVNLTENVGFGLESTHTRIKPDFLLSRGKINFPLIRPELKRDVLGDLWILRNAYGLVSYKRYLLNLLKLITSRFMWKRIERTK